MPDFSHRSDEPEMLDFPVSAEMLYQNLKELEFLNRKFGGHRISINGLKKLVADHGKTYHIIDLGCGGGDTMRSMADWARKESVSIRLTGIDSNCDAIRFLIDTSRDYPEISGFCADYRDLVKDGMQADIFHCSLFCHHLSYAELLNLFMYFRHHAETGFIVNDLYRGSLGYYGARILTTLAKGSVLSRNDGPISVLRSFRLSELRMLMKEASIEQFKISQVWSYRVLLVGYACKRN